MPNRLEIDKGAFRVKDWWWSKAALLMGMVYLFTVWFGISFYRFLSLAVLSLTAIVGFASFGYLLNDLFDIRQDTLAGKRNFLVGKPVAIIIALFLYSLGCAFAPWIFLPTDRFSYYLIAFQISLLMIYSIPPIRLKERGLAGIVADALYAHAVPPILAAYTFSLAADRALPGLELVLLFAWQFANGTRNILIHQSEDTVADRRSGSKNFASTFSDGGFVFSVKYLILAEIIFSLAFFSLISGGNSLFLICGLFILGFSIIAYCIFYKKGYQQMLHSTWRYFPNNIYEIWLPPLFLLLAASLDMLFVLALLVHLALFNFDIYRQLAKNLLLATKWAYHAVLVPGRNFMTNVCSAIVNYSIYYTLLLFGIDLKKENTSAIGYFKKKWKKNHA